MEALIEAIEDVVAAEPQPEVQPDPTQPGDKLENQLTQEISELWSSHVNLMANHKTTARELRQIRAALAERLYTVKNRLARPGRGGEWRGWLRERGIPRSSADRLCARHAETLGTDSENVPSEATISGPTKADIRKVFCDLWPRIRKVVTTYDSALMFLGLFIAETCLRREWRGEELVIFSSDAEEQEAEDEATPTTEQGDGDGDGENGEDI